MENQPNQPNKFNEWSFKIVLILLWTVMAIYLFKRCENQMENNNKPHDTINVDSLKDVNIFLTKNNAIYLAKADSLKQAYDSLAKLRIKAKDKFTRVIPDAISVVDNSNCDSISKRKIKDAIDSINVSAQAVLAADSMTINNLNNTISVKDTIINNQQSIIKNDSTLYEASVNETKQAKKELRNQKIKTWIVGVSGAAATALMTYFAIRSK